MSGRPSRIVCLSASDVPKEIANAIALAVSMRSVFERLLIPADFNAQLAANGMPPTA